LGLQHKKKVEYHNAIPINETDKPKPTSVYWRQNSISSKKTTFKYCSIALMFCILSLVIFILLFQWLFHTITHYIHASFFWMGILPATFILPLYAMVTHFDKAPNEYAVSHRGVYFYYNDPIMRYLEDDFIGWKEVDDIKLVKSGKSGYWKIIKINGTKQNIDNLEEKNRKIIISAWKEWKNKLAKQHNN